MMASISVCSSFISSATASTVKPLVSLAFPSLARRTHLSKLPFNSLSRRAFSVTDVLSTENTHQQQDAIQSFWEWLCEKEVVSASSPIVKPEIVSEGLGLVAQKNLYQNEVVLEVPKKLWINTDTVSASEIGRVCGGLKPWVSIALFLLSEMAKEHSPWRHYLDILPKTMDSTIYWSEEELAEIQGTQLLSTTLGVKDYVQSEFMKVTDEVLLPNIHLFPSPITLEDFLWAFGILRSRAFSRLRGQNLVLIPFADLVKVLPPDISFRRNCRDALVLLCSSKNVLEIHNMTRMTVKQQFLDLDLWA